MTHPLTSSFSLIRAYHRIDRKVGKTWWTIDELRNSGVASMDVVRGYINASKKADRLNIRWTLDGTPEYMVK